MKHHLREIAAETMTIIDSGGYRGADGTAVDLVGDIARAVAGTRLYLPGDALPMPPGGGTPAPPVIDVTSETTLAAARRLCIEHTGTTDVACLVFASAKNPGGGFLSGAQAQEEAIARASALYACQTAASEFYAYHRRQGDLRYSDRVIYSPAVPVFRDDDGTLLPQPYLASFLTAAAPNLVASPPAGPPCGTRFRALSGRERRACLMSRAPTGIAGSCWAPGAAACFATTRRWSRPPSPKSCATTAGSSKSCSRCTTAGREIRSARRSPNSF